MLIDLKIIESFKKEHQLVYREFIKKIKNSSEQILLINEHHPCAYRLMSELKQPIIDKDLILRIIIFLEQNKSEEHLIVSETDLLIPQTETRNETLILDKISNTDLDNLNRFFSFSQENLDQMWHSFVSIIKTITFVNITGKEHLLNHFSGSNSDVFGSIHMSRNTNLYNLIECITHESAHHWLNLFELSEGGLIEYGWEDESYDSPWRQDKRPLMGVLHGVFVFHSVYSVLLSISNHLDDYYMIRLSKINGQVLQGFDVLDSHLNKFNPLGLEFYRKLKSNHKKLQS